MWFGLTLFMKAWRLHRTQLLDKPDKDEEDGGQENGT
jgi:hypothetical protein